MRRREGGPGEVIRRASERRNLKSSASQHVVPLWKTVMTPQLEQMARSATRAPRIDCNLIRIQLIDANVP